MIEDMTVRGFKEDCLLYTSDAADDMQCVDLGGRRIGRPADEGRE